MFLYRLVLILVLFFPFNLYEGVLLQLGYWQTKKIVLLQELHAFLLIRQFFFFFFFFFFEQWQNGNPLKKLFLFIEKTKVKWEIPKENKTVFLFYNEGTTKYFKA